MYSTSFNNEHQNLKALRQKVANSNNSQQSLLPSSFEEVVQEFIKFHASKATSAPRKEGEQMSNNDHSERLVRLETIAENNEKRFDRMERQLDTLTTEMRSGFRDMHKEISDFKIETIEKISKLPTTANLWIMIGTVGAVALAFIGIVLTIVTLVVN